MPAHTDEKHNPQPVTGVLFLDWDYTIVTSEVTFNKQQIFKIIGKEKTKNTLKRALELGMDIHIITARVNVEDAYKLIFADLAQLGLLDKERNEEYWRKHIHCLTQTTQEKEAFDKDEKLKNAEIPKRKAECIRELTNQYYLHLEKDFRRFYDDEKDNCDAVTRDNKVICTEADPFTASHIDDMIKTNKKIECKIYANKTAALRLSLLQNLNGCLHAIYPQRHTWGKDAATVKAAGGAKEIHIVLYADNAGFTLESIAKINEIAIRRSAKGGCSCLPALFGGRKAPLQKLYEILSGLKLDDEIATQATGKMEFANQELAKLLAALQPKAAPIPLQSLQRRALSA